MGRPKALLEYRGDTFLDGLIGLFSSRCAPVIVVLGAGADEIRNAARRPATFVVNPDYSRGQITSMQCGLRAVPAETDGVLFTLVDHPAASAGVVDALLDAGGSARLRVPRHKGQQGHPIWFSKELIPEFLAVEENGAARDVVRRHASETEFLDLDDPGVLENIDTPRQYRALTGVEL
jgi:CTP:molybdopterin cytidylyltransferase MocA